MIIKFSNRGNTLLTSLSGEIDHHCAQYIKEKIDSELFKSHTKNVILDFKNVSVMDSSGIGVLIGRYKNITGLNGKIYAVNLNQQITKIFEMSGLKKLIPIYDTVEMAYSKL